MTASFSFGAVAEFDAILCGTGVRDQEENPAARALPPPKARGKPVDEQPLDVIRRNTDRASRVRIAAMRAPKRLRSRSLRLMALAVGALLFTVPLLALNCEIVCSRGANRAATVDGRMPARHCDAHRGASPARPSGDAPAPDRCGHHAESVVVQRVAHDAASGSKISVLDEFLQARTVCVFDRSGASSVSSEGVASLRSAAARPSILRL